MLENLQNDPQEVPAPVLNETMRLLVNSKKDVKIDVKSAFLSVWVTNAPDGSEDYLVSDKIFGPVGESMTNFRTAMIANPSPETNKELINSMIPPKGIQRGKNIAGTGNFFMEKKSGMMHLKKKDDEKDVDAKQLFAASSGNIPMETTSQESVKKSSSVIG